MSKNTPVFICSICESITDQSFGIHCDFGTHVFQCPDCNVTQSEFLSDETLEQFYESRYRGARHETITKTYLSFMSQRAAGQYDFIATTSSKTIDSKTRVLDYGAGCGQLISSFPGGSNNLFAIELDVDFADHIRESFNVQVLASSELQTNQYEKLF